MKKYVPYVLTLLCIMAFGLFIYPGLYEYDKLDQRFPVKINRITGDTQILRGYEWYSVDNPSKSEMQTFKDEVMEIFKTNNESIKNDVIREIENKIMSAVQSDLQTVKEEITEYKKFQTDPENYFSLGSTKKEVKNIMGTPTQINSDLDWWYYGSSKIEFKSGKVSAYDNWDKNLRVK